VIAGEDTSGGGEAFEQVRAGVVERLRARREEIEEVIFARVSGGAFAGSGDEDAEYVAGLRAAVMAALKYGLEGIERGEEWVGQVPPVVSEQARRAARSGVGLDTVLRRYVVGHTLLGEFVMEEADRGDFPLDRGALREVLRVQAVVLDRLLEAITAEHTDELRRAGRSPEQRRAERVRKLLDGGTIQRLELDYELDAWHLGMIVVGAGAAQAVSGLATRVDRRLLSVPNGEQSVWVWLGGRERFAFADVKRVLTGAVPLESVMLALGEPAEGLQGWRLTHQQAQAALVVALRRPRPLTRYADVALLASALKDEALARALVDIYLAPLEDSRGGGPILRQTLRAYLDAERSVSSAAAALGVVRKTVENRLRTIEERLGRTLHSCAPELEVALQINELATAPQPPEIPVVG
jgi:DNA-binding Lrp family transcriptional regulator